MALGFFVDPIWFALSAHCVPLGPACLGLGENSIHSSPRSKRMGNTALAAAGTLVWGSELSSPGRPARPSVGSCCDPVPRWKWSALALRPCSCVMTVESVSGQSLALCVLAHEEDGSFQGVTMQRLRLLGTNSLLTPLPGRPRTLADTQPASSLFLCVLSLS